MMQAEHALGFRQLNGRGGEMSPLAAWGPALAVAAAERTPVTTGS
jgi:hypothetical protein